MTPNITRVLGDLPRSSAFTFLISKHHLSNYHDHLISRAMPFLTLPAELLKEIVRLAIQTATSSPNSCIAAGCRDFDEVSGPRPCTPPAATSLAHTCRVLRAHALPLMYESVAVNLAHSGGLHAHLNDSPYIASRVRSLTLFITDASVPQHLHGIIQLCRNLEDLQLDGSHSSGQFIATLLIHVRQRSLGSLTIRTSEWLEIVSYISTAPSSLHTLRPEDSFRPFEMPANSAAPVTGPQLQHVHAFICHTALFDRRGAQHGGGWLSHMVPNATVVDMHLSDITMQFLQNYVELGTMLTELTVHFVCAQPVFCRTVAKLAPGLRRFTAHGGWVCEVMFAAEWSRIEVLDVVCRGGCKGVRVDVVREALLGLVAARSEVDVRVAVDGGRELAWSGGDGANVAALQAFGVLEEVWADY